MTYRIDGTPLDQPTLGWVFRALSNPLPRLAYTRPEITTSRDGVLPGLPVWASAPELDLVVMTPRENLATLIALVADGSYLDDTDRPGRRVHYELLEATPTGYGPADSIVDVTFRMRYPAVYWRDSTETTTLKALTAASVTVDVFPGLSAPIPDAIIRVRGACTSLQITDAGGSWITFPGVSAGQWLRIDGLRAYLTGDDAWAGGIEQSGVLDTGGPRGFFEITPTYTDPNIRAGKLTVATASRAGAQIEIRGRGAHIV